MFSSNRRRKEWRSRRKFARGRCAKCELMFTLGKNIFYRGRSLEENLICDECFGRSSDG